MKSKLQLMALRNGSGKGEWCIGGDINAALSKSKQRGISHLILFNCLYLLITFVLVASNFAPHIEVLV